MFPDQGPTIVDQFFQFLQQLILPNWSDLILLVPWLLFGLILLVLLYLWVLWRRAGAVNRPRVVRPVAGRPPPGTHLPGPSRWPFVVPIGAALVLFSLVAPRDPAAGLPFNPLLLFVGLVVTLVAIAGWLLEAMREWRATAQAEHAGVEVGAGAAAAVALPLPAHLAAAPTAPAASAETALVVAPAAAVIPAETAPEPPVGVHLPAPSPWPFFAPIAVFVILLGVIFSAVLLIGGVILGVITATGWYLEAGREYVTTEEFGHPVPRTRDARSAWPSRLVPLFAAVIAISVLITLAPVGLAWLNALTPASATPAGPTVPQVPEISAHSAVSFDTKTLVVPCCRPFDLIFHNGNASVPHNVQISTDSTRSQVLFDGDVVTGVADATYHVGALQPGDYYFACKIHPNMNGTLQARPESGAPPAGPSPSP
jgi:plastocyanin